MFGRALLPLLVLALGAAAAASPEVLRLDADSFEPSIASRPFVAVAFVAPWCAHCKRLEPEWRAAASKLAARGRNIALATLDTTAGDANAALAARHDVRGFPSIRIFRDGDLQSAEAYEGRARRTGWWRRSRGSRRALRRSSRRRVRLRRSSGRAPWSCWACWTDPSRKTRPWRARRAAARAFAGDPDDPDDWQSVPFGVVALPALVPERTTRPFANALKEDGGDPRDAGRPGVPRVRRARLAVPVRGRVVRTSRRTARPAKSARAVRGVARDAARRRAGPRPAVALDAPARVRGPRAESDRVRGRRGAAARDGGDHGAGRGAGGEGSIGIGIGIGMESESVGRRRRAASNAALRGGRRRRNANALAFFDVDPKRLPAVVIHDTRTDARYVLHDATDADALTEWLAAFRAGTLAPTVRSAGDGDGARGRARRRRRRRRRRPRRRRRSWSPRASGTRSPAPRPRR